MRALKIAWIVYAVAALCMMTTSIVTGRRATKISGRPHYLLTRTKVAVDRRVAPTDATDAEFDALFEDAGEAPTLVVDQPIFVLGLLDATAPFVFGGGGLLIAITLIARRRRKCRGTQRIPQ